MTIDASATSATPAAAACAATASRQPQDPPSPREESADRWQTREQTETLLAGYPHVARCEACHAYAEAYLVRVASIDVLIATLAYHDSGHRYDLIEGPGRRFSGSF